MQTFYLQHNYVLLVKQYLHISKVSKISMSLLVKSSKTL